MGNPAEDSTTKRGMDRSFGGKPIRIRPLWSVLGFTKGQSPSCGSPGSVWVSSRKR
jgi:hypothetical protein